jgi:ABC-type oligopeptide transport system substrate-binding subunit
MKKNVKIVKFCAALLAVAVCCSCVSNKYGKSTMKKNPKRKTNCDCPHSFIPENQNDKFLVIYEGFFYQISSSLFPAALISSGSSAAEQSKLT